MLIRRSLLQHHCAGADDPEGLTWGPGPWAELVEAEGEEVVEMRPDWDRQSWQCRSSTCLKPAPPQSLFARGGEDNAEQLLQLSLQMLQVTP